jgi:hypothetical protein
LRRLLVALTSVLLVCACTGEPGQEGAAAENESAEIAQREDGLAFYSNTVAGCTVPPNGTPAVYWAPGDTVEVCFAGVTATTMHMVNTIQTTLENTWGRASSLRLHFNGNCPASINANWVSIFPFVGGTARSLGAPGRGNRLAASAACHAEDWNSRTDIQLALRDGDTAWLAAHEFGHVLGFNHEHARTDNNFLQGITPNCPTSESDAGVQPNEWVGSGEWITVYDPLSVMNYCGAFVYGRTVGDPTLTPLDILGAEMFYPWSLTNHKIACVDQCFSYGDGGAIVRSSGTITSKWKARGAKSLVMRWTSTGGIVNSEYAQASLLPANTSTFNYSFTDVRGRANTGSAPLINSNAAHAAIITAL